MRTLLALLCLVGFPLLAQDRISLDGSWDLATEPRDAARSYPKRPRCRALLRPNWALALMVLPAIAMRCHCNLSGAALLSVSSSLLWLRTRRCFATARKWRSIWAVGRHFERHSPMHCSGMARMLSRCVVTNVSAITRRVSCPSLSHTSAASGNPSRCASIVMQCWIATHFLRLAMRTARCRRASQCLDMRRIKRYRPWWKCSTAASRLARSHL